MQRLHRPALSPEALRFLKEERADLVAKKRIPRTQVGEARRLWALQRNKTFVEVRRTLEGMCSGILRCMYCEDSRGVAIDHFWPLSRYPLKAFDWPNFVFGCSPCNTAKSNDFPLSARGAPLLIDPTSAAPADDPGRHFQLTPRTGKLLALTRRGRESRRVYGLDRDDLNRGRRNAWIVFQALIILYARLRRAGREAEARKVASTIKDERFHSVLAHLLAVAGGPAAGRLKPGCVAAMSAYPEIRAWG